MTSESGARKQQKGKAAKTSITLNDILIIIYLKAGLDNLLQYIALRLNLSFLTLISCKMFTDGFSVFVATCLNFWMLHIGLDEPYHKCGTMYLNVRYPTMYAILTISSFSFWLVSSVSYFSDLVFPMTLCTIIAIFGPHMIKPSRYVRG